MTDTMLPSGSVADSIVRFSDNPSAYLALNHGNESFTSPAIDGAVVYRSAGTDLVQFGGPFCAPTDAGRLLSDFTEFARSQGRGVVAIQVQGAESETYRAAGYTVNQVGASYSIHLPEFSLAGTKFMRLRNKISRARALGLTVAEVPYNNWEKSIAELDQRWLASKGEDAHELEFLIGELGGEAQTDRRLFVAVQDGVLQGYISYSPAYGSRPGWLHDLSRRIPDDIPGIMELINSTAIATFIDEGVDWLHFGFTPFTSLDAGNEVAGYSPGFAWFMTWLWENGAAVYPAATQLAYKKKWNPQLILPEYVAFAGPARMSGLLNIFRAAHAL